jgi:hypothetical protein
VLANLPTSPLKDISPIWKRPWVLSCTFGRRSLLQRHLPSKPPQQRKPQLLNEELLHFASTIVSREYPVASRRLLSPRWNSADLVLLAAERRRIVPNRISK